MDLYVETGKRNPGYGSLRRLAAGIKLARIGVDCRAEQIERRCSRASTATAYAVCGRAVMLTRSGILSPSERRAPRRLSPMLGLR
jgi:hypothetical protein